MTIPILLYNASSLSAENANPQSVAAIQRLSGVVPSAICFICRRDFQFGPYWYHGRYVRLYGVTLCDDCWASAVDGWPREHERTLCAWLNRIDLAIPARLPNGLLPIDTS